MSALIKEYKDGLEIRTLVFRGKNLSYIVQQSGFSPRSEGRYSGFEVQYIRMQLKDNFPDLQKEVYDKIIPLDRETCEDEIFRILGILDEVE